LAIRTRLTLWYIGLLTAILVTFSLLVYGVLAYNLTAQVDRTLLDRAQQVGASIIAENDPVSILTSGGVNLPPVDIFASPTVYIQVIQADGSVAQRSQNLGNARLPLDEGMLRANRHRQDAFKTLVVNGTRLRLYSVPVTVGDKVIGAVQVGEPLREVDATLRQVGLLLILGSAVTLLVASLVGILLARAALRSIDELTQTAQRIARTRDLGQRIPVAYSYDEVGRLATTFNEMLDRLDGLFQAQLRLGADVSHELRTPLTTIRGNVDLLRRGAADDPEARDEALQAIETETARMSRIVADLLFLAQADAGLQLELGLVELDTLVLDVYRQAKLMANGVKVHLGHEDQAVVSGDADRLKQLMLNLVDNALKYTPAGGEVRLSLYHEQGWVRVSVQDTGPGIPPEDLPHIFERFYRVGKERVPGMEGTGLGLSIAKWLAEAHGGKLTVESKVGRGSTFTLWLPELRSQAEGPGNEP
jgi:two-component system OmpR family sensor kinase